jgi:hypothetical protein
MRDVVRLEALEFDLLMRQGKVDPAIDNLALRLSYADALLGNVDLQRWLIRNALHGVAIAEVESVAMEVRLDDAQLARLQTIIRDMEFRKYLKEVLVVERGLSLYFFHRDATRGDNLSNRRAVEFTDNVGPYPRPEDCARALRFQSDAIAALDQPAHETLRTVRQLLDEFVAEEAAGNRGRYATTASEIALPAYVFIFEHAAEYDFRRDAADAMLAVRRYAQLYGSAPVALIELVPAFLPQVPIDGFDGRPLRYRVEGDNVTIYSVGNDLRDDGGLVGDASGSSQEDLSRQFTLYGR